MTDDVQTYNWTIDISACDIDAVGILWGPFHPRVC